MPGLGRVQPGVFGRRAGLIPEFLINRGMLWGSAITDEHDRISVEWSAGAMVALSELADYYKIKDPERLSHRPGDKYFDAHVHGNLAL